MWKCITCNKLIFILQYLWLDVVGDTFQCMYAFTFWLVVVVIQFIAFIIRINIRQLELLINILLEYRIFYFVVDIRYEISEPRNIITGKHIIKNAQNEVCCRYSFSSREKVANEELSIAFFKKKFILNCIILWFLKV